MPLMRCSVKGVKGWKFGKGGKCYVGTDARDRAKKQGIAIETQKHAIETGYLMCKLKSMLTIQKSD